jgi:hypothetical protein
MSFATISTLKTQLNKGARANLFEIELTFPTAVISAVGGNQTAFSTNMGLLCKSAAVPGFTIGVIEVPFRAGRRIKIAGDRTFADWTVTIINDENHTMRNAFNAWVNYVSTSNYDSVSKSTATDYYSTIKIKHLKADGSVSRQYLLTDAYPTDVGALDLSFDSTDTLSEFTVNFQYHYLQAGNKDESFAADADMTS